MGGRGAAGFGGCGFGLGGVGSLAVVFGFDFELGVRVFRVGGFDFCVRVRS